MQGDADGVLLEELVQLSALLVDVEVRAFPGACRGRDASQRRVARRRLVDRTLHWLHATLPTAAARADALLALVTPHQRRTDQDGVDGDASAEADDVLDALFRKIVGEEVEEAMAPLHGVAYVRRLVLWRVWRECVVARCRQRDDAADAPLEQAVRSSLRLATPYARLPPELRACLPHVRLRDADTDAEARTLHLLTAPHSLRKAADDFALCRRRLPTHPHVQVSQFIK